MTPPVALGKARPLPFTLAAHRWHRCRWRSDDRQRCCLVKHDGDVHGIAHGFDVTLLRATP